MSAALPSEPATVHVLPARQFDLRQRRHFTFSVVLPTLGALALPLCWPGALLREPLLAAALLWGMWFLVGGVGVSVGLHRHFSHRSFQASGWLRAVLGVLGQMATQGPVVYWVALHRLHHAASDRPGDPHSPQPRAWPGASASVAAWRGHIGWVWSHDVPKPTRYARELIGDTLVRRLSKAYPLCVAAGLLLPAVAGALVLGGWAGLLFGAYWGGVLRIALGHHVIWAINSRCHLSPDRSAATGDHSANVGWLALPSWGESWHHNHHAAPASARFGQGWRQPDIGWWVVRSLVALGWARTR